MPIIFKGVNEGADPMDLVATHQRLLIGTAMRTSGPILELGVGWYSTPILHEISLQHQRFLLTLDNNEHWLNQFKALNGDYHVLELIGWWGDLPVTYGGVYKWGMCFVDQGQPIEREYTIRKLLEHDAVNVFVMHDTEEGFAYGYSRTLPMFRYQYTDKCQKVWTTVASNCIDVSNWFVDLPPVEPSEEIT